MNRQHIACDSKEACPQAVSDILPVPVSSFCTFLVWDLCIQQLADVASYELCCERLRLQKEKEADQAAAMLACSHAHAGVMSRMACYVA